MAREPTFMIVGTPRSGTTLVQRLVCELPGVKVPIETQFFWQFAPRLIQSHSFPIGEPEIREELSWFIRRRGFDDGHLSVENVLDELEGRCDNPLQLFGAIVRQLAGEAAIYGEKTPQHLFWWRALAKRRPDMKFIAVVRDPRAVVASNLDVEWTSKSHVLLAERWCFDQKEVTGALRALGAQRCLVLRYEDVVADAPRARESLASFLGLGTPHASLTELSEVQASEIMRPDESWKKNAVGAITQERVEAWRHSLTPAQADDVSAICRQGMRRFGYRHDVPTLPLTASRLIRLGWTKNVQRLRYRLSRYRHLTNVRRMAASL